ncbi:MAG: TolB protein [Thermoleophilaceae bacterium]|jgi:Tol biopolymer transport system component|nr:TolB protein [Thermoleophilaceae bacterium]
MGQKRLVIAAVAALVCGLLGTLSAGAATGARARNGLIFFDRTGAKSGDIFAMGPSGSGFHRFVRNGLQPSVSADGRLVVFQGEGSGGYTGGYELAVVRTDGSKRRVIATQSEVPDSPSFSPDSTEIVFDDGASSIWAVDTAGSNLRRLVSLHKVGVLAPVFAPNGRAILFVEYNRSTGTSKGLFLMDPDGTHVRAVPRTGTAGDGSFSPDSKTILFPGPHDSIYRMSLNGSHLRRLTHPPTKGKGGGPAPGDDQPKFSPDGKKILFIRASGNLPGGGWSGPHGVFTINANGSHLRRLKDGAWFDPSWQPRP